MSASERADALAHRLVSRRYLPPPRTWVRSAVEFQPGLRRVRSRAEADEALTLALSEMMTRAPTEGELQLFIKDRDADGMPIELQIRRNITPRAGALSVHVCRVTSLVRINLTIIQLTSLPDCIGDLTALTHLNLCCNRLTTLPDSIGRLTKLEDLHVGWNFLATLPDSIGRLTALEYFNVESNRLTALTPAVGRLTALKQFHLGFNQLTTLPDEISGLPNLTHLCVGNNLLTALPYIREGDLTRLKCLTAAGNRLTASSLSGLAALQVLNLNHNQLTALPDSMAPALEHVDIRYNPISEDAARALLPHVVRLVV